MANEMRDKFVRRLHDWGIAEKALAERKGSPCGQ